MCCDGADFTWGKGSTLWAQCGFGVDWCGLLHGFGEVRTCVHICGVATVRTSHGAKEARSGPSAGECTIDRIVATWSLEPTPPRRPPFPKEIFLEIFLDPTQNKEKNVLTASNG